MPLEEFLRRVAAREGADADEADLYEEIAEHARAVFATLAEAVSIKEWFDVIVELPEDTTPLPAAFGLSKPLSNHGRPGGLTAPVPGRAAGAEM